jgi:hypothetical protein
MKATHDDEIWKYVCDQNDDGTWNPEHETDYSTFNKQETTT